jgi:hypothetical protein
MGERNAFLFLAAGHQTTPNRRSRTIDGDPEIGASRFSPYFLFLANVPDSGCEARSTDQAAATVG